MKTATEVRLITKPHDTRHDLTVRVLRSFAEAEPLRSAWDELVLRAGADVYQTFDWCRIWWHYYGAHRQLHLLFCFAGDDLVGLIPAFTESLWLGPVRLRIAKLVSSDFTLNLCNLPVLSDFLQNAVARAIRYFLGELRCDMLLLGPLSAPLVQLDELRAIGKSETQLVGATEVLGDSCNTFFKLPQSNEEYLKSLDKKQRSNIKRSIAQLSAQHRLEFDSVSSPEAVQHAFEEFHRLHESQWRAAAKLGHFGDWPSASEFNREIVRTLGAKNLVRFYRILVDGQVVSSQYTLEFGDRSYWRLPSRACGPDWDRFGLGSLGLVKKIEALIGLGLHTVEAGRGHYAYKIASGGRELPMRTIQFNRRGSWVLVRARAFRACALLLDIVYYKIVFARLSPRLSLFRRSLWPVWIRSTW